MGIIVVLVYKVLFKSTPSKFRNLRSPLQLVSRRQLTNRFLTLIISSLHAVDIASFSMRYAL